MDHHKKDCFKLLASKLKHEKDLVAVDRIMVAIDNEFERCQQNCEQTERDLDRVNLLLRVHDNHFEPNHRREDEHNVHVLEQRHLYLTWERDNLTRQHADLVRREEIGLNETDRINIALADVKRKCSALTENEGPEVVANWRVEFQMHVDIVYGY